MGDAMTRRERHGVILELIAAGEISTQTELVAALKVAGVSVVQGTVSRDVADLGLVKIRGSKGRLVYAPPGKSDPDRLRELHSALRRWSLAIEASGNLVVVTTPSGYADPLAEAIDSVGHPWVVGTMAGENTILVVAREGVAGSDLCDAFRHGLNPE
ncbi:MAG: arginine repressor [Acidimicrobiia bacterium]